MTPNYLLNVATLVRLLRNEGKEYLSMERKMTTVSSPDFKFSYLFSYKRIEKDEDTFLYRFFIDRHELGFDENSLRSFLFQKFSDVKGVSNFYSKKTTEAKLKEALAKFSGGLPYTPFEKFQAVSLAVQEFIKKNKAATREQVFQTVIDETTKQFITKFPFHDGALHKDEPLSKKKSENKIAKTLGNRYFHMALYGNDDITGLLGVTQAKKPTMAFMPKPTVVATKK